MPLQPGRFLMRQPNVEAPMTSAQGQLRPAADIHSLDRHVPWVRYKLQKELQLLDRRAVPASGQVLLDVGAGWGDYLPHFVERGFSIIALDIDPANLFRMAGVKPAGYPLHLAKADAHKLPLRDGTVDVAFMGEVLEHVVSPEEALKETYRVLRPGGRIFVDVPWWHELGHPWAAVALRCLQKYRDTGTPPLLFRLLFRTHDGKTCLRGYAKPVFRALQHHPSLRGISPERFVDGYLQGDPTADYHRHFFFPGEWCRLMQGAGFRIEVVTGAWLAPSPLNRWEPSNRLFAALERRLGDRSLSRLAQILIIEARKPL